MQTVLAHIRPPSAGVIIGVLALVLAMGGTGYAVKDEPKKAHAKFYSPSDYKPGSSETGYRGDVLGQLNCTKSANIEGNEWFGQPISLPQGAEITKVTFYYIDTDPNQQLRFHVGFTAPGFSDPLEEFPEATSTTMDPADRDANDNSPQSVDVTPTAPVVVDNTNKNYRVSVEFSSCGTTNDTPDDDTWILADGVRVHYKTK